MKLPSGYQHPIQIGTGAYSHVYRAWQQKLERHVALKVLQVSSGKQAATVEKEVRALSSMHLSCLPALYDVHRCGGAMIIVMEWIRGIPLSRISAFHFSRESKNNIAAELIETIATVHAAGMVHRDLKPDNVIATADRGVVLVDLGFFEMGRGRVQEKSTSFVGTPAYLAPELLAGKEDIDYRKVDLYCLGILLKDLVGADDDKMISGLLHADPTLRPADGVAFEREWAGKIAAFKNKCTDSEITGATAEYTAGILFDGAKSMYSLGRLEDAYVHLTESLEAWPDNSEALDFLQNRFAGPVSTGRHHKALTAGVLVTIGLGALAGAYFVGKKSVRSGTESDTVFSGVRSERYARIVPVEDSRHTSRKDGQAALRVVEMIDGIEGVLAVRLPSLKGQLLIDNVEVTPDSLDNRYIGSFPPGTHRVEWRDAVMRRTIGETVDLLPFSVKTISFERVSGEP
ncbi:MAG: protein kinase [Chitinispirillaceae bacterium]|nr:protein kinase [Chitinispirillaceae bacterium]